LRITLFEFRKRKKGIIAFAFFFFEMDPLFYAMAQMGLQDSSDMEDDDVIQALPILPETPETSAASVIPAPLPIPIHMGWLGLQNSRPVSMLYMPPTTNGDYVVQDQLDTLALLYAAVHVTFDAHQNVFTLYALDNTFLMFYEAAMTASKTMVASDTESDDDDEVVRAEIISDDELDDSTQQYKSNSDLIASVFKYELTHDVLLSCMNATQPGKTRLQLFAAQLMELIQYDASSSQSSFRLYPYIRYEEHDVGHMLNVKKYTPIQCDETAFRVPTSSEISANVSVCDLFHLPSSNIQWRDPSAGIGSTLNQIWAWIKPKFQTDKTSTRDPAQFNTVSELNQLRIMLTDPSETAEKRQNFLDSIIAHHTNQWRQAVENQCTFIMYENRTHIQVDRVNKFTQLLRRFTRQTRADEPSITVQDIDSILDMRINELNEPFVVEYIADVTDRMTSEKQQTLTCAVVYRNHDEYAQDQQNGYLNAKVNFHAQVNRLIQDGKMISRSIRVTVPIKSHWSLLSQDKAFSDVIVPPAAVDPKAAATLLQKIESRHEQIERHNALEAKLAAAENPEYRKPRDAMSIVATMQCAFFSKDDVSPHGHVVRFSFTYANIDRFRNDMNQQLHDAVNHFLLATNAAWAESTKGGESNGTWLWMNPLATNNAPTLIDWVWSTSRIEARAAHALQDSDACFARVDVTYQLQRDDESTQMFILTDCISYLTLEEYKHDKRAPFETSRYAQKFRLIEKKIPDWTRARIKCVVSNPHEMYASVIRAVDTSVSAYRLAANKREYAIPSKNAAVQKVVVHVPNVELSDVPALENLEEIVVLNKTHKPLPKGGKEYFDKVEQWVQMQNGSEPTDVDAAVVAGPSKLSGGAPFPNKKQPASVSSVLENDDLDETPPALDMSDVSIALAPAPQLLSQWQANNDVQSPPALDVNKADPASNRLHQWNHTTNDAVVPPKRTTLAGLAKSMKNMFLSSGKLPPIDQHATLFPPVGANEQKADDRVHI